MFTTKKSSSEHVKDSQSNQNISGGSLYTKLDDGK